MLGYPNILFPWQLLRVCHRPASHPGTQNRGMVRFVLNNAIIEQSENVVARFCKEGGIHARKQREADEALGTSRSSGTKISDRTHSHPLLPGAHF